MILEVLLPLLSRYLVDGPEDGLQRAELLQQGSRGLLTDPGNSGDVVGAVPTQADQVRYLVRPHPVALEDAVGVIHPGLGDPLGGGHHPDTVTDQLESVTITGHHDGIDPEILGLGSQGGDHVVRLVSLDLDVGVAEGLDQAHQGRPLLPQEVGFGRPVGLVLRVDLLATRHPGVPGNDYLPWPELGDQLDQHRGEAENGVGRPPVTRGHRVRKREECPVGQTVPVQQE